jgi:hypothetical protein
MDPSIRQQLAWSPGQRILNDTGAREPEHTFHHPVPIVARIVWADDGEEHIDTEAAGWGGQFVYVRMPDRRYRLTFGVARRGGHHPPLGTTSEEITFPTPMNSDGLKGHANLVERLVPLATRPSRTRRKRSRTVARTPRPTWSRPDDLRSRNIKSCRLSDNERQPHDGHVSQDCSEPGVGRR